jgi:hypothetical protein
LSRRLVASLGSTFFFGSLLEIAVCLCLLNWDRKANLNLRMWFQKSKFSRGNTSDNSNHIGR